MPPVIRVTRTCGNQGSTHYWPQRTIASAANGIRGLGHPIDVRDKVQRSSRGRASSGIHHGTCAGCTHLSFPAGQLAGCKSPSPALEN